VLCLNPTDFISYCGGDKSSSGYLANHNIDPSIVNGGSFGSLWTQKYRQNGQDEQFYANPLVYTINGRQTVVTVSEQNYVYN